tara:strand:- start:1769 stop:2221 length:453 start_codon:yes stop_codon:yes gene_type:complete
MLEFGGTTSKSEAQDGPRETARAVKRGLLGRCPNCGEGRLFRAFLKPVDACATCGEEIHHHRADDFPPYLAIFIVGHIVVAGFMATDTWLVLESWQHLAIWIPVTVILTLALLPPLKGGVIGLQWALRMHGFGGESEDPMLAEPAYEDAR